MIFTTPTPTPNFDATWLEVKELEVSYNVFVKGKRIKKSFIVNLNEYYLFTGIEHSL